MTEEEIRYMYPDEIEEYNRDNTKRKRGENMKILIKCLTKSDKERLKGLLWQFEHKLIKLKGVADNEIKYTLGSRTLEIFFDKEVGKDA